MTGEDSPGCKVCGAKPSIECTFWYGTKLAEKRDYFGGPKTTYSNVAGSRTAHYCKTCILKYRLRKLVPTLLALAFAAGMILAELIIHDIPDVLCGAAVIVGLMGGALLLDATDADRKMGARKLRDAHRTELEKQGYDQFWHQNPKSGTGNA